MRMLSTYRTELMGFAIAWTVLYHAVIFIPKSVLPVLAFKLMGATGVDMFFLLSGIGMSYSWRKEPDVGVFLAKRLLRIIPVYALFVSLALTRKSIESGSMLPDLGWYVGLDFFLERNLDRWFVPSILACYLLFALLATLGRHQSQERLLMGGTLLSLVVSVLLMHGPWDHLLIFTIRLPLFFLGIHVGTLLIQGQDNTWWTRPSFVVVLLMIALVFWAAVQWFSTPFISWRYGLLWYPSVLMAYPLCWVLSRLFAWLSRRPAGVRINRWLATLGEYSLEIYLTHAFIYGWANKLPFKDMAINIGRYPEYVAYTAMSIALAIWLGKVLKVGYVPRVIRSS